MKKRKLSEIQHDISEKMNAINANPALKEDKEFMKSLSDLNEEYAAAKIESDALKNIGEQRMDAGEQKELKRFSFCKTINELASGKSVSGLEKEVVEEGEREAKTLGVAIVGLYIPEKVLRAVQGQSAGANDYGKALIESSLTGYIEALKNALVLTQLGAYFLGGLNGKIGFPKGGTITGSWLEEGTEKTIDKVTFGSIWMAPHRLTFAAAFTKELLHQTSYDVERIIVNEMIQSHARMLEEAALIGTGSNGQPTGVLSTANIGDVALGTNGGNISWAKAVALESTVAAANAAQGKLAYLTNSKVVGELKTIERATNTGRFLMEGGELNGYKVVSTNAVPSNLTKGTATACSPMIFGDWSQLRIGQWGGLDLIVDPYKFATSAQVAVTISAFHDVCVARPESFAAIKDIKTTI